MVDVPDGFGVRDLGNLERAAREKDLRIAELEALLREIDAKVIFEAAVSDGTGPDLQERVEATLRIGLKNR